MYVVFGCVCLLCVGVFVFLRLVVFVCVVCVVFSSCVYMYRRVVFDYVFCVFGFLCLCLL